MYLASSRRRLARLFKGTTMSETTNWDDPDIQAMPEVQAMLEIPRTLTNEFKLLRTPPSPQQEPAIKTLMAKGFVEAILKYRYTRGFEETESTDFAFMRGGFKNIQSTTDLAVRKDRPISMDFHAVRLTTIGLVLRGAIERNDGEIGRIRRFIGDAENVHGNMRLTHDPFSKAENNQVDTQETPDDLKAETKRNSGDDQTRNDEIEELKPARWFGNATDQVLTPDALRKANAAGRIKATKIAGRWA